ncbi:MAG: glycosyltransferase family 4 protein [Lachnospiraceae bacterium]|nr:glycosyltransferase family 4 protein [Lachnospiraceae bacterium]
MRIAADMTSLSDNLSGLERYAFCLVSEMIGLGRDRWYLVVKNEVPERVKRLKRTYPDRVCLVHVSGGKLMVNQVKLPLVMSNIKADAYLFPAFPVPLLFGNAFGCQCAHGRQSGKIYSLIADTAVMDVPETMKLKSRLLFGLGYWHSVRVCKSIITISHFSEKRIRKHFKNVRNIIYAPCGVASGHMNGSADRIGAGAYSSGTKCAGEDSLGSSEKTWADIKKKYGLPEKYILVLSTLEPRKNIGQVFSAYADFAIKNTDAPKLVVAGRKGWLVDEELASIKENFSDRICITGFIDDDDLKSVYSHADFFVDASVYEGFGMPPVEALANGVRHVLVSDIPAHREVLGEDAVYFKLHDVDCLSTKMARLYRDNTEHQTEPACLRKYSWKKSAENVYRQMLAYNKNFS